MICDLKKVLTKAMKHGYAVPAFNINNLEILKAVLDAAIEADSPIIAQTSESAIKYAGLQEIASLLNMCGLSASVPVVIHLDHGKDLKLIRKVMDFGYTSVMYDGSALEYKENLKNTAFVAALARKKNISCEGELGMIGRSNFLTDPKMAQEFVEKTGIDALAVAIGTAHGIYKFGNGDDKRGLAMTRGRDDNTLDFTRLKEIKEAVNVPLVLHGASGISKKVVAKIEKLGGKIEGANGISDAMLKKAVKLGISKVNTDSDLRLAFTLGVRRILVARPETIDPRIIMGAAMEEIKKIAVYKFKLLGSYGKA